LAAFLLAQFESYPKNFWSSQLQLLP